MSLANFQVLTLCHSVSSIGFQHLYLSNYRILDLRENNADIRGLRNFDIQMKLFPYSDLVGIQLGLKLHKLGMYRQAGPSNQQQANG